MRKLCGAWRTTLACLLFAALLGSQGAEAQTTAAGTAEVVTQLKAAYLYRFGSYVEWPSHAFAAPDSPISIGILGAQPLAETLKQMVVGRTVNGREVKVVDMQPEDRLVGLHILFIGAGGEARAADILVEVKSQPTLTVTESENAFAKGSMINFVVVDGKVRFDIASKPPGPADLSISARLMTTARKVVASPS
jgi:hypothetical protein